MKHKELKSKPEAELKQHLVDSRKELMKLNSQVATGSAPKKPSQIRQTRKTIARILTLLRSKGEKTA